MHNWDYDLATLEQSDEAELWQLERTINYDLRPGEHIPLALLRKYIRQLNIPDDHRWFLQLFTEVHGT